MSEKRLDNLEKRIAAIEARNQRVEADKAWETSTFRAVLIFIVTYVVVAVFFIGIHEDNVWVKALEPAAGVFLSGLLFSALKERWIVRKRSKK